jgi:hypothetical protein
MDENYNSVPTQGRALNLLGLKLCLDYNFYFKNKSSQIKWNAIFIIYASEVLWQECMYRAVYP